ncbi:MAG: hypothetical protein OQJ95_09880 [Kangiella sp.]|nr:hypothetical protein [Kangiella sp.]
MFRKIIILGLVLFISGCVGLGGIKKAYEGTEKKKKELAVIECSFGVTIKSIDGNSDYSGSEWKCDYAVIPGKHKVSMTYYKNDHVRNGKWRYKDIHTIEFETVKGFEYSLMAFEKEGKWDMKILAASFELNSEGKSKKTFWADYKKVN